MTVTKSAIVERIQFAFLALIFKEQGEKAVRLSQSNF